MQIPSEDLIKILQTSISPVVMISGVGLLLLSMTNRFGRAIDRARALLLEIPKRPQDKVLLEEQIRILYRRAQILRLAISMATISLFLVGTLIFSLFATFLFSSWLKIFVICSFIGSLLSLLISLGYFLYDLRLSLLALGKECQQVIPPKVS